MDTIREVFRLIFSGDPELVQILTTTLVMSFFSTAVSSLLGFPLGVALGRKKFRGRNALLKITNTLMSLPPVVAGLVVFLLFRSVGPFGRLHLLFTVPVMVVAQVVLITPVVVGMTAAATEDKSAALTETAKGLGLAGTLQVRLLMRECAAQFVSVVLLAFGRSIAEVGAVALVGGNIQHKTRVMTTAIMLNTNMGHFETSLALGIILLLLSLVVNVVARSVQEKLK